MFDKCRQCPPHLFVGCVKGPGPCEMVKSETGPEQLIEREFDKAFTPELRKETKEDLMVLMKQTKTIIALMEKRGEGGHQIVTNLKASWADMYWTLHDQDTIYRV